MCVCVCVSTQECAPKLGERAVLRQRRGKRVRAVEADGVAAETATVTGRTGDYRAG